VFQAQEQQVVCRVSEPNQRRKHCRHLFGANNTGEQHLPVGRLMEHEFTCPYCGEEISMVLDLSVGRQTYIEDCEVCCKPIEVSFTVEDDDLGTFYAKTLG